MVRIPLITGRSAAWIGVLAAATFMPPMARGDLILTYDLAGANLLYDVETFHLNVADGDFSELRILKEENSTFVPVDSALIENNGANLFDFTVSLSLTDEAGPNNWSATGTVRWTDLNNASSAVEANFTSTSISIDPNNNALAINGVLSPLSGSSLLVNRGDPWVYDGSEPAKAADEDGVPGDLFIANPGFYSAGTLTTLRFGMDPSMNLDSLFGADRELFGGNVKGAIIPAPGAAFLGALGLTGVLGRRRRISPLTSSPAS